MSEIIKIFLFVYIIIKTSCVSNLTLTTVFNISNPKIKINNQDFSMRMDIPMIIFKNNCYSNESTTIEFNGENKIIYFCKENITSINNQSINIVQKFGENEDLENYIGFGINKEEIDDISFLDSFNKSLLFESYLNKNDKCRSLNIESKIIFGNLSDEIKEENSISIFAEDGPDSNWITNEFTGYGFGKGSIFDSDNVKKSTNYVALSNVTAVFKEGISYEEPSIFPDEHIEKVFSLTKDYGCEIKSIDNDTRILKCNKNLSLFLVFSEIKAFKVNPLLINKKNGTENYLNILFKKNQSDYIFNPSILGSFHRVYQNESQIQLATPCDEEVIELSEPTIKETIITIVVITFIVVIITIVVMKLMKKDTNDNVDYNNMQQI
jgi:hypothetical protein